MGQNPTVATVTVAVKYSNLVTNLIRMTLLTASEPSYES